MISILVQGKCDINLNHSYSGSLSSDIKMIKTFNELDQTFREEDLSLSDDNSGLYKARITDSKIKLAFRRTADFSMNVHQQVTLYTVTWGRNVELVLDKSKKRPTLNTFCGPILDEIKRKRVCIMI